MALVPVTPRSELLVSVADAKAHLRIDGNDEDSLIEALIRAATDSIDGRDGWLGRALTTQTWELRVDAFSEEIRLPLPPLKSVDSVKYIDEDGVEQTVDPSVYRVLSDEPAKIVLAYDQSWPTTRAEPEAVRIGFTAGYGAAVDVPTAIKQALLLHVGTLYRDRESTGQAQQELPMAYGALLAPYRVWGI